MSRSPRANAQSSPWRLMARRFAPYMRPQRALIGGSLLALVLSTAMRLLEPWPLAFVIDHVLSGNGQASGLLGDLAAGRDTVHLLWLCAGAVVAIAALKAVMNFSSTVGLALAGSRVLSAVRLDLFAHLQRLSLAFHGRSRTGDLTMRLINDIGMLREATVTALMPMLANIFILGGMFAIMLVLNWKLTLVALLPMPLLLWSTRRASRQIHEVSRAQRKREGSLAAKAAEFMAAIRTVQSLSLERATMRSFGGDDAQSSQQNVKSKRLSAGLERKVDLIVALATALVLLQGAYAVIGGSMSPGDLLIFISYLKSAFRPVREYAKYTGRLSKALAAGERVVDLLDEQPDIQDRPDAQPLQVLRGDVRFADVGFGYRSDDGSVRPLFGHLNFTVAAGQAVAITGPSGAGKSSITSLLLRLYDPDQGQVLIDGQNIRDCTLQSLRQQISLVPQESLLFGVSVRENIALAALGDVTEAQIVAAAQLANAHEFIQQLPQGYDTVLGERGSSLSGGQRQRIAIARAAIRNSPLLILDEPTVGLDSENEHQVTQALLRLMRGRTSILVTHDLAFAAQADRILFIENGQIREQGSHAELLGQQGRYAELWRLQHPAT